LGSGASFWRALRVFLLSVAAAVPAAGAWWLVTPLPQLVVDRDGVLPVGGNTEVVIAADGWFALCAAVAGATCAVIVFLRLRTAALRVLLELTVGGLAAAGLMWRLGTLLGPAPVDVQARALAIGDRFEGPLELSALGVLVAWPLAATAVYFSLLAGSDAQAAVPRRAKRGRARR